MKSALERPEPHSVTAASASPAEAWEWLRNLFFIAHEQQGLLAVVFSLVVLITLILFLLSPRVYRSDATFIINQSPYEFASDANSNSSDVSKLLIQSLISGIESKDMQMILAERLQVPTSNLCFVGITRKVDLSKPNTARIDVQPVRNSRVAILSAFSTDPVFAQKVANQIMDEVEGLNTIVGRIESLNADLKVHDEKIDRLTSALVDTTAERIRFQQQIQGLDAHLAQGASLESYPAFQDDENLRNFMQQEAVAEGAYQNLASTTTRSSVLSGKMSETRSLQNQVSSYAKQLALGLRSGFSVAQAREESLEANLKEERAASNLLKEKIDQLTQAIGNYKMRRDESIFSKDGLFEKASVLVVTDRPQIPEIPVQPNPLLYAILGLFAAFFFALASAVFNHHYDHYVKHPKQLELWRGITCLAVLTEPGTKTLSQPFTLEPESIAGLSYLRNQMLRATLTRDSSKFFIFSGLGANAEAAKLISKLAILLAKAEKRTLVIDFEFHQPQVGSFLGIKSQKGLTDWLSSNDRIQNYIEPSVIPQLSVIQPGRTLGNIDDLISRRPLIPTLIELQSEWDFILIHAESLLQESHILLAAPIETPLITVVRYADANLNDLDTLVSRCKECGFSFAGLVIHHYPQKRLRAGKAAYELGVHRYVLDSITS